MSLAAAQNSWVNEAASGSSVAAAGAGLNIVNVQNSLTTNAVLLTTPGTAYALLGTGFSYTSGNTAEGLVLEVCANILQGGSAAGSVTFTLVDISTPGSPVTVATSAALAISAINVSTVQYSATFAFPTTTPNQTVVLQLYATPTTTTSAVAQSVGALQFVQSIA